MSFRNDTPHPEFSRSGNQAYKGFERTAVLPEDPELTHTEPGTPMGDLMRRFWQPVCLSEELTDEPRAIRILGEDLVAFRDKSSQVGVLHRHCCHRGASLEFGIIRETGIRCCYHGFQYNVDGTLIGVPGDAYEGAERDTFICNALKDYEQSYAGGGRHRGGIEPPLRGVRVTFFSSS